MTPPGNAEAREGLQGSGESYVELAGIVTVNEGPCHAPRDPGNP